MNEHSIGAKNMKQQVTISGMQASRRAGKERAALFSGLEAFANLSEDLEDYHQLALKWPTFWPVDIFSDDPDETYEEFKERNSWYAAKVTRKMFEGRERGKLINWSDECHLLALIVSEMLQKIWANDDASRCLAILLGIGASMPELALTASMDVFWGKDTPEDDPDRMLIDAWIAIKQHHEMAHPRVTSELRPDWIRGSVEYESANDFQLALFLLMKESWRARVCPECDRCYVADKSAQRYCSGTCYLAVKQRRDLEYWKTKGITRRAQRKEQTKKQ